MAGTDLGRLGLNGVARTAPADAVEALGHPRQQALQRALHTLVGQTLPARVLARLGEGGALVQVAGTRVSMALPAGIGPDAELALKVVAAAPRPTFQLGTHPDGSPRLFHADAAPPSAAPAPSGTRASSPAAQTAAAPQAQASASSQAQATARTSAILPAFQPASAQAEPAGAHTSLSSGARLIGSALAQVPAAAAQALRPAAPLLSGGEMAAPRIAAALQAALDTSGLFYESHLADWTEGRRPLDSLRAEPQMRQASSEEPAALKLVAQQLASHELQQVAWQGQLVPGLPFEWRIAHDPPARKEDGDGGGEHDDGGAWHSKLRLQFTLLGEVEASLSLHGDALQVHLRAASREARDTLRAHGAALETALGAAGLDLSGLHIAPGGEAG